MDGTVKSEASVAIPKSVVACLSEDSKKFKEINTQKMDKADFSRTKESWTLLHVGSIAIFAIMWHFSVADSQRQSAIDVSINFCRIGDCCNCCRSWTQFNFYNICWQSPIGLQQAFPLSCNCYKTWSAIVADWIRAITTIWQPAFIQYLYMQFY